jgi:hypothetical protein
MQQAVRPSSAVSEEAPRGAGLGFSLTSAWLVMALVLLGCALDTATELVGENGVVQPVPPPPESRVVCCETLPCDGVQPFNEAPYMSEVISVVNSNLPARSCCPGCTCSEGEAINIKGISVSENGALVYVAPKVSYHHIHIFWGPRSLYTFSGSVQDVDASVTPLRSRTFEFEAVGMTLTDGGTLSCGGVISLP